MNDLNPTVPRDRPTQNNGGFHSFARFGKHMFRNVGILASFYVLILIAFSFLSPYFLSVSNITNIFANMAFIGIMAAALTPLMIAGGLDLSAPAIAGMAGVVMGILASWGISIWFAAGIALLIGGSIGAVNGFLVEKVGINSFIATLGMLSVIEGGALVLTGGLTKPLIYDTFNTLGSGRIYGIPVIAIFMFATFAVVGYVMTQTRAGRYIHASGGNSDAATIAGVPVKRVRVSLYVFSGFCGSLAGILLAARLGATAPTAASASLLTVIAAVILGGTSLLGGRGFVLGTLIAVLILGTLDNALVILGVSSFWQEITHGVVLLLAVGIDQINIRRSKA